MNSRSTNRLVAALLLLLAACGLVRSIVPAAGAAQAVVYNRARQRRALRRRSESLQIALRRRPPVNAEAAEVAPSLIFYRWLFQRPPPFVLSFA